MVNNNNLNGCIIRIDFSPSKGHEQAKQRPALVISGKQFNNYCNMTWVLPISHAVNYPLHIDLPKGLITEGKVLCEHIRSMDLNSRGYKIIENIIETDEGKAFYEKIKKICCNCIME